MTAEEKLLGTFREWRRLAETEAEAIRRGDFSLLSACEAALRGYPERASQLFREAKAEWSINRADRAAKETGFFEIVKEVLRLKQRNAVLLEAAKAAAQSRLECIQNAGRQLRQLRRSYGSPTSGRWCSYS